MGRSSRPTRPSPRCPTPSPPRPSWPATTPCSAPWSSGASWTTTTLVHVLTPNLGDFEAAIVDNGLVLALPTDPGQAFTTPRRPTVSAAGDPGSPNGAPPPAAWHAATWQIGAAAIWPSSARSASAARISWPSPSCGRRQRRARSLTPLSLWLAGAPACPWWRPSAS